MRKIAILGATGSIGVKTLNVIRRHPGYFDVTALAAGRNVDLLTRQIREFAPSTVAVRDGETAEKLGKSLPSSDRPVITVGMAGYEAIAAAGDVDVVVSAMSGAVGLLPTMAAIEAGKTIALANKEILVMAGGLIRQLPELGLGNILPLDSEHSAIFQCLLGHRRQDVRGIILTASGGPFLHLPAAALREVTPSQALAHPKWSMGKKITIDSATLMNKGLEVIEARWLFDIDYDSIHIHIHPQSIVHSLVEFIDGSVIAQLGVPEMELPIAYALFFPERKETSAPSLDLCRAGKLEFFPPDVRKFPNLLLAYEAGRRGGTMPTVLNAANEVAVQAFIEGEIALTTITEIIENTMSLHKCRDAESIEAILAADTWGRKQAVELIEKKKQGASAS